MLKWLSENCFLKVRSVDAVTKAEQREVQLLARRGRERSVNVKRVQQNTDTPNNSQIFLHPHTEEMSLTYGGDNVAEQKN